MSNARRMAYLDAMGIDVWLHRGAADGLSAEPLAAKADTDLDTPVPTRDVDMATGVDPAAAALAAVEPSPEAAPGAIDVAIAQSTQTSTAKTEQEIATTQPDSVPLRAPETTQAPATTLDERPTRRILESPVSESGAADVRPTLSVLQQQAAACTRCELHSSRLQSVFGDGNPDAEWMFVGEAPGAQEDRQGLPFVGPAGQLLNAMLVAIGLKREQVYIANLVKCRPPRNRDPRPEELASCQTYINGQLEIVKPKIIIALGRFAAQSLTGSTESIGRLRNTTHSHAVSGTKIVATYHPAYLLRSPGEKAKSWQDLLRAKEIVANEGQG